MGRVLLAAPRSFCAGVDRAIESSSGCWSSTGRRSTSVTTSSTTTTSSAGSRARGRLRRRRGRRSPGRDLRPLGARRCPGSLENCERRGLRVVDAVCPLVSKVHAEARRYADSGHLVALSATATTSR